jgi:hypothetical protein
MEVGESRVSMEASPALALVDLASLRSSVAVIGPHVHCRSRQPRRYRRGLPIRGSMLAHENDERCFRHSFMIRERRLRPNEEDSDSYVRELSFRNFVLSQCTDIVLVSLILFCS